MTEYRIHPDAPRDDEGHPIHPERGHHICGRGKSENTTPTEHGRERDDVPYCLQVAGWGTEKPKRTNEPGVACKNHGGNAPKGEANGAYKHGGYSKFHDWMFDTIPEEHREALEALDLQEHGDSFVETQIKRLTYLSRITGDERFTRELRQWIKEFGPVESNPERLDVEHGGSIDGTTTHELDEDTKALARELIRRQQEADASDE